MKKALVILLCALAVFAIVSCKQDPKPEPQPTKFVVTFDTQGGSKIDPASVEKDAKVEKPADPIKTDNKFFNWYTEATFENLYDFETPVTEDITLYAKWIPEPAREIQMYKMTAGRESDRFQFQWFFASAIKPGDVISFKYKSNRVLDKMTNREMSEADKAIEKLCSDVEITGEPDAEGWYSFSYTIPDKDVKGGDISANAKGIGVGLLTNGGNTKIGEDYIYLKEITYTSGTTVTTLSLKDENRYSGAKGPIETSFIRLVATKGTDGADDHKYDQDKFSLFWNPNVQVNPGDVVTITFKIKRNDPLTKGRDFTYSIRGEKKWFSEVGKGDKAYPQFWSTFSEPDLEGWITVTYVFPEAAAETKEPITYPAWFRVDFRDTKIASPTEGREADILYIRSATITQPDPEDPTKTITSPLELDVKKTGESYACPTVEKYFFPVAE